MLCWFSFTLSRPTCSLASHTYLRNVRGARAAYVAQTAAARDGVRPLLIGTLTSIVEGQGCTKTRNGEIRNGKWRNAEMRKWGTEDKSMGINFNRRTKRVITSAIDFSCSLACT